MEALSKEQILMNYGEVLDIPVLNGGFFVPADVLKMRALWLNEDPTSRMLNPFMTTMAKVGNGWDVDRTDNAISGTLLSRSKSSKLAACLKKNAKGADLLEISFGTSITQTAKLMLDTNAHGKAHFCGEFGNLAWSWDENHPCIAYIAEPKLKSSSSSSDAFAEVSHWGEGCTEVVSPIICVWRISHMGLNTRDKLEIFDVTHQKEISPHRILFCPGDETIVLFGLHNEPKYGKLLCNNRSGNLYTLKRSDGACENLLLEKDPANIYNCFEGLSFSKTGKFLMFFARANDDPYNSAVALFKMNWSEKTPSKIVIPIPAPSDPTEHALYNVNVPDRAWIDDRIFIFTVETKGRKRILFFNAEADSYSFSKPEYTRLDGSYSILDVYGNNLMAAYSSLDCQPTQMVTTVSEEQKRKLGTSNSVLSNWHPFNISKHIQWTCERYEHEKCFLLKPFQPNGTLVVAPHGGPHSASLDSWPDKNYLLLVNCGYYVLFVNYSGSTGYGEKFLRSLLKKGGSIEVEEVHAAAMQVKEKFSIEKMFALGISYGGSIALHLVSKYTGNYNGCVCINPVIDLHSLTQSTDIADLPISTSCKEGYGNTMERGLTLDDYRDMYNCSPLSKVQQVQVPLFLAIGKNDQRVIPHYKHYTEQLRRKNVDVKTFIYPGDHSMSGIEVETNLWVNMLRFMEVERTK